MTYHYKPETVRRLAWRGWVIESLLLSGIECALWVGLYCWLKLPAYCFVFVLPSLWRLTGLSQSRRFSEKLRGGSFFELREDRVVAGNAFLKQEITWADVSLLITGPDGFALQGRRWADFVRAPKELEDYSDLLARVESWLPRTVVRRCSWLPIRSWTYGVGVALFCLFIVGLGSKDVAIALPVCCLLAVLLSGLLAWAAAELRWVPQYRGWMIWGILALGAMFWRIFTMGTGAGAS